MRRTLNLSLALFFGAGAFFAGTPAGASGARMDYAFLAHEVDRLGHTARVLYVAAHPDDENTRLLAWLANERHLTVGYLSVTRGDGGQNLIGSEKGDLLGVIRTQELLAARRTDGAVQRFTRMRDFGYSKSPEETLKKWGKEEALSDVVWVLRTFRPDVVITRFNETPPNHGHHIASAILAKEAVEAAADPKRFAEQLRGGVTPWKVVRLVHNHSHWRSEPPKDALRLDVGGYDPRYGLSYGELAALSRSQHKSQGFGAKGERGELLEHFVHVEGDRAKRDLLEDVALGWERFGADGKKVAEAVARAKAALTPEAPERALPALWEARDALARLPQGPRTLDAIARAEALIAGCAGLFVRAAAASARVTPGGSLPVTLEVVMRRPAGLELSRVDWPGAAATKVDADLELNGKQLIEATLRVPKDAPLSSPYWLRRNSAGVDRHLVEEQALVGLPEGPPPLTVGVTLTWKGRNLTLTLTRPVEYAWTDRVQGERVRRVMVVPPLTVTPGREAVMLPNGKPGRVTVRVRAGRDGVEGTVRLPLPKGWRVRPAAAKVKLDKEGEEAVVHFEVTSPKGAGEVLVSPVAEVEGRRWSLREELIDYPHLPVQVVLQPSVLKLVPVSLRLPRGTVGYVDGSGDTVMEDLAHVGVRVERLNDETLRSGDLSRYAAILVGIRAYNTRPALRSAHPRLMAYVKGGGTVVVQYNTHSRWSPLEAELGPYPLELSRDRVTDETAKVRFLEATHPVLTRPNRLGPADFEGWVQERGLYFAGEWDPRYKPLLEWADPGEKPLRGGLLVARYGKGRYVYTGISFFRQLPAGVPGAYRLMANLIGGR